MTTRPNQTRRDQPPQRRRSAARPSRKGRWIAPIRGIPHHFRIVWI